MTEKKIMSARERARDIARLASEGMTSREIAKQVGVNHARVCFIAERFSIPLSRPGLRRFGLYISDRRASAIRELAAEAKVSPAVMIERMTRVILDDGLDLARKRLGKLVIAMEKRS
jgi:hypothetical protein